MKKRGISPLIAVVLLVGIVVVISVLVYNFAIKIVEEQKEITESETNLALLCSQEINLNFFEICEDNNDLKIYMKNIGSVMIEGFKFKIFSLNEFAFDETNEILEPYVKKRFTLSLGSLSLSDIKKIEIIPVLSEGNCPGINLEIDSSIINECLEDEMSDQEGNS